MVFRKSSKSKSDTPIDRVMVEAKLPLLDVKRLYEGIGNLHEARDLAVMADQAAERAANDWFMARLGRIAADDIANISQSTERPKINWGFPERPQD